MSIYSKRAADAGRTGRARRAALVVAAAAHAFEVDRADILAHRRDDRALIGARRLIAYLLVEEYGFTLAEAGRALQRDHCTISYHLKEAKKDLERDPEATLRLDEMTHYIDAARVRAQRTQTKLAPVPQWAATMELHSAVLASGGKPAACA